MKILAMETSTMLGGVAIMDDDSLLGEFRLNVRVTHSERLMWMVDDVLNRTGLSVADVDVFAVAAGPGSFTGLRIGLSTIKGLVYATGKRVVSVPTLEAFAWNLPFSSLQVCPLLDARKQEVYAGIFRWGGGGFQRVLSERAMKIESLIERITEPTVFLGEGALLYRNKIEESLADRAQFAPTHKNVPCPANVALLGMVRARRGVFDDPASLVPSYIRRSEAEVKEG